METKQKDGNKPKYQRQIDFKVFLPLNEGNARFNNTGQFYNKKGNDFQNF